MRFASEEEILFGEEPYYAANDLDGREFTWSDKIMKEEEFIRPNYLDDDSKLQGMGESGEEMYKDAIGEVEWEDARTDHSIESLTKDERKEMQVFHYLK